MATGWEHSEYEAVQGAAYMPGYKTGAPHTHSSIPPPPSPNELIDPIKVWQYENPIRNRELKNVSNVLKKKSVKRSICFQSSHRLPMVLKKQRRQTVSGVERCSTAAVIYTHAEHTKAPASWGWLGMWPGLGRQSTDCKEELPKLRCMIYAELYALAYFEIEAL